MSTELKSVEAESMEDLRSRVDDLAVRLMLGSTDIDQWALQLKELGQQAAIAKQTIVAAIAAESMETILNPSGDANSWNAVLSNNIARMQQALAGNGSETECNNPVPLHSAQPSEPFAESQPSPESSSLAADRELLADFILEARDHLVQVEIQIMTLEKAPEDREAINTVFRAFHTIKGLSAFLEFTDMREVAHETETLLDLARGQKLRITPGVVDIVLAAADFLKISLARLEKTMHGSDAGPIPERANLVERIRGGAGGEVVAVVEASGTSEQVVGPEVKDAEGSGTLAADSMMQERRKGDAGRGVQIAESHSVKVDTAKLDFLVEMAGEMVVAQSMVQHHPELAAIHSPAVLRSLAQLARITSDLQKTAMSMRMVPVGGLFQKMSRLVRDLTRKTGKHAELEAIGADTELDRNVVEELADPLMHMVRNAADHGLEGVEERRVSGKDTTGLIRLRASHEAGHIVIEISGALCVDETEKGFWIRRGEWV